MALPKYGDPPPLDHDLLEICDLMELAADTFDYEAVVSDLLRLSSILRLGPLSPDVIGRLLSVLGQIFSGDFPADILDHAASLFDSLAKLCSLSCDLIAPFVTSANPRLLDTFAFLASSSAEFCEFLSENLDLAALSRGY
jgi:hypothetical protein